MNHPLIIYIDEHAFFKIDEELTHHHRFVSKEFGLDQPHVVLRCPMTKREIIIATRLQLNKS